MVASTPGPPTLVDVKMDLNDVLKQAADMEAAIKIWQEEVERQLHQRVRQLHDAQADLTDAYAQQKSILKAASE